MLVIRIGLWTLIHSIYEGLILKRACFCTSYFSNISLNLVDIWFSLILGLLLRWSSQSICSNAMMLTLSPIGTYARACLKIEYEELIAACLTKLQGQRVLA